MEIIIILVILILCCIGYVYCVHMEWDEIAKRTADEIERRQREKDDQKKG